MTYSESSQLFIDELYKAAISLPPISPGMFTANDDGDIVSIRISGDENLRISGSVWTDRFDLVPELRSINVSKSYITGKLPRSLGNCTKLESMELEFNNTTGPIPPEFRNLTNLEHLSLWSNKHSGVIPDWLGELPKLRYLDLRSNAFIREIPASIGILAETATVKMFPNVKLRSTEVPIVHTSSTLDDTRPIMRRINVTSQINEFNNIHKKYLRECIGPFELKSEKVHDHHGFNTRFSTSLLSDNGIFYDYAIRKMIDMEYDRDSKDSRAELGGLYGDDYETYRTHRGSAVDIIEEIWNVSQNHNERFGRRVIDYSEGAVITEEGVSVVEDYIRSRPEWTANSLLNPSVGTRFFMGDADIITDKYIVDIKCTMTPTVIFDDFIQLLVYGLGWYLNTSNDIKSFVIYNPMKGTLTTLTTPKLDYDKFKDFYETITRTD